MPVYLCQAGTETDDPWRHGLQVFGEPFMIEENDSNNESGEETVTNLIIADWKSPSEVMKVADVSETPVRRLKHSEVVVADDICIAFERYWLRLKWPGSKGGFAGYVAMGKASELHNSKGKFLQFDSSSWLMKTRSSKADCYFNRIYINPGI